MSNEVLSVFVLPIEYKGDNGARGTVQCPFFNDFTTLAWSIHRLNYLQMDFRTLKTAKVSSCEILSAYGI